MLRSFFESERPKDIYEYYKFYSNVTKLNKYLKDEGVVLLKKKQQQPKDEQKCLFPEKSKLNQCETDRIRAKASSFENFHYGFYPRQNL